MSRGLLPAAGSIHGIEEDRFATGKYPVAPVVTKY